MSDDPFDYPFHNHNNKKTCKQLSIQIGKIGVPQENKISKYKLWAFESNDRDIKNYEGDSLQEQIEGNSESNNAEQISDTINLLILKNKINAKNAFQVPVIDVGTVKNISQNDDTSWSKISSILQNSSKIYGFRVDFIAQNLNKITGSISRTEQNSQIQQNNKRKSFKKDEDLDEQQNPICFTAFNDQTLKQIQETYLDRLRINQKSLLNESELNAFDNAIRKMFDQNGISNLLLAKLSISRCLSVQINPICEYSQHNITNNQENILLDIVQNQFNCKIMECIEILSKDCQKMSNNQQIEEYQQIIWNYDPGYQLPIQTCLFDNQQNKQCFNQFFDEKKNQQNGSDNKERLSMSLTNSLAMSSLSHTSLFVDLFNDKRQKNKKKGNKKQKKQKVKHESKQIIFYDDFVALQKKQVFLRAPDKKLGKQKRVKDKNILKEYRQDSFITNLLNYCPFSLSLGKQMQQGQTQAQCQYDILPVASSNLSNILTEFISFSDFFIKKPPSIKQTRQKIWKILEEKAYFQFDYLYNEMKNISKASEAIVFLSLLHLCNQKGLQIRQQNQFSLLIKNPKFHYQTFFL